MRDKLFAMDSIDIRSELGRGHYGVVYHAHVVDGSARWPVALKCAKTRDEQDLQGEDVDDEQVAQGELMAHEELVKEGEVMAALPYHENIANLQVYVFCKTDFLGKIYNVVYVINKHCFQGLALDKSGRDPRIFLMIEYCGNRSMHRYLLANRVHFANELRYLHEIE